MKTLTKIKFLIIVLIGGFVAVFPQEAKKLTYKSHQATYAIGNQFLENTQLLSASYESNSDCLKEDPKTLFSAISFSKASKNKLFQNEKSTKCVIKAPSYYSYESKLTPQIKLLFKNICSQMHLNLQC
ncbi:hypothetical protein IFO69_17005 [Echinicola sp. CAU 1574]|uniref:Uncharacterized protein n=1 Tax=Echinicola arenosa TaxID=2774144 RepID=A0ABR9ANU2_9BACT|nr:hypothetical protein [Echinicola arenosa]MBD8490453.1 hypothetical protein [Echinicola arenosa]